MFMQAFGVETTKTVIHMKYNLCYLYAKASKNNTITVLAHKTNKVGRFLIDILYLIRQCFNFTYFQITWFRITFKSTSNYCSSDTKILQVSNNFP